MQQACGKFWSAGSTSTRSGKNISLSMPASWLERARIPIAPVTRPEVRRRPYALRGAPEMPLPIANRSGHSRAAQTPVWSYALPGRLKINFIWISSMYLTSAVICARARVSIAAVDSFALIALQYRWARDSCCSRAKRNASLGHRRPSSLLSTRQKQSPGNC
jgi:hypothetical protein